MNKILADYCINITDGEHGTVIDDPNGEYYLLSNKNIVSGQIKINSKEDRTINKEWFDKINKRVRLDIEDVLISTVGTIGKVAIVQSPINYTVQRSVGVIKTDKKQLDPYFLAYQLQIPQFQKRLVSLSKGAVQKCLFISDLKTLQISVPPLEEQKVISSVLRNIDLKIQNNKQQIETLESLAKTIYDYWFVQFDFPNEDGKPYKSSGGKMVWNEELKREIPEGWGSVSVGTFIENQLSGDWGKETPEKNYNRKVICIRGTDFSSIVGGSLSAPTRYILEKNMSKILISGDLLVEISGGSPTQSTGRICYINDITLHRVDYPFITSNFCKVLRLKNKNLLYYFYCMWSFCYTKNLFFGYESKTTGIKNLLLDSFLNSYKVAIPSELSLLERMNNSIADFFIKIQMINIENDNLEKIKNYLLPLLMNGQVQIR